MTTQTVSVNAGRVSAPIYVPAGATVSASAAAGGSVNLEFTLGSLQDINNNVATWVRVPGSPFGDFSSNDVSQQEGYLRATATGGTATVSVNSPETWPSRDLLSPWRSRDVEQAPDLNSAWICGDSFANNSWATVGNNFVSINLESIYDWANSLCGRPLDIVANTGTGGINTINFIKTQLPRILAARPGYVFLNIGTNDIYNAASAGGAQTGADTARRIQYAVTTMVNAGITPIWTTVAPRTASYTAARLAEHIDCNNRLRQWAQNARCGIFWDQWPPYLDNTSATCAIKAGYAYDSPALHPNNYGAFVLGKRLAAVLTKYVRPRQVFAFGAEDQTTTSVSRSNLLVNPYFSGTGGTVSGTGCAGTMPDNWSIDWATRTGLATATAAIIDITDSDSGVIVSKAIQVTISGTASANDDLRISQATGFNTLLSGGDQMRAECIFSIASPANVIQPRFRVQANSNESTWWGNLSQAGGAAALAQAFTAHGKTRPITVLGTGAASAARFDFRLQFNGAGTNTVLTIYCPRVSKNQPF